MDKRDLVPASIGSGADFNVYPQYSQIESRVALLKDFCTASTKRLLTQCLLHKYKNKPQVTLNLHAKITTTQLVCNYTNKFTYKLNIEPNQKDQVFMLMDSINHYSFLNLCIIHNQTKKNSLNTQDKFVSIHTPQDKLI